MLKLVSQVSWVRNRFIEVMKAFTSVHFKRSGGVRKLVGILELFKHCMTFFLPSLFVTSPASLAP